MSYRTSLLTAIALLLATSFMGGDRARANPPDNGYVGAIVYENGKEAERLACDTLPLVKEIYDAAKENVFLARSKFDELAQITGIYNEAQCMIGPFGAVKVLGSELLGPIVNPMGSKYKFYMWAIHVDNSPKGGTSDYWMLYLDTKDDHAWLRVGQGI